MIIKNFELSELSLCASGFSFNDVLGLADGYYDKDYLWHLPTRRDYFEILSSDEENFLSYVGEHSVFVTDEDHLRGYIIKVVNGIPHTELSTGTADAFFVVRYTNVDEMKQVERWADKINSKIINLFRKHNTETLDLYEYEDKVEVPQYIVRDDDSDRDIIESINIEKNNAKKDCVAIYDVYTNKFFVEQMSVDYQLAILSMVEDIFNRIDADTLPLFP